jgi:hypothetical protein
VEWRDRRNDEDDGGAGFGPTEDDDFVAPVSEALQGSCKTKLNRKRGEKVDTR